jgi:chromosome segregation ATPase
MVRRRGSGSSDNSQKDAAAGAEKLPLDATLLDLKATLEAVQPKDTVLSQQVSTLKAELEAKDTLIAKLQTETQQTDQLKAELAEAKKMILKLSEVNAKPLTAISPIHTPASAKSEPKPEAKPTLQVESSAIAHNSKHETALRKILQHPTQPGSPPSMPSEEREGKISEMDIGWMD